MLFLPDLQSLNYADHNHAIAQKLPDSLQNQWKLHIACYDKEQGCFPPFNVFASFVKKEAKTTNVFLVFDQLEQARRVEALKHLANKITTTASTARKMGMKVTLVAYALN